MRSGNPALNDKTFGGVFAGQVAGQEVMTLSGTVNKCFLLAIILLATAGYTWNLFFQNPFNPAIQTWMWVGLIGGIISALVAIFKPTTSPIAAPIYAAFEGLALGGISATFEARFPGIVVQAAGLTMTTLIALLMAYRSGFIKATENFKLGVAAATGGIALMYLFSMIGGFFGMPFSFLHDSSLLSIGISGFIVVIAALNLVMDFDFIEGAAERRAPKFMEWRAALGLMITLVWLYFEILRLLSKLQSRD
ncbi:Bax inhibitor-1/YccA family protein [bacterium]|nr:Bax inhibitor-1/YccA family protein [bacterium]